MDQSAEFEEFELHCINFKVSVYSSRISVTVIDIKSLLIGVTLDLFFCRKDLQLLGLLRIQRNKT